MSSDSCGNIVGLSPPPLDFGAMGSNFLWVYSSEDCTWLPFDRSGNFVAARGMPSEFISKKSGRIDVDGNVLQYIIFRPLRALKWSIDVVIDEENQLFMTGFESDEDALLYFFLAMENSSRQLFSINSVN